VWYNCRREYIVTRNGLLYVNPCISIQIHRCQWGRRYLHLAGRKVWQQQAARYCQFTPREAEKWHGEEKIFPMPLIEPRLLSTKSVTIPTELLTTHWEGQMTDPTSRQRGRPTETRQQLSENILPTESNIWSQVPEWARYLDILTDWPSVVTWLRLQLLLSLILYYSLLWLQPSMGLGFVLHRTWSSFHWFMLWKNDKIVPVLN
jgi:hypothetical protein